MLATGNAMQEAVDCPWFDSSTLGYGRTQAHPSGIDSCIHNTHPALKRCLQQKQRNTNAIIDLLSADKCCWRASRPGGWCKIMAASPGQNVYMKEPWKGIQKWVSWIFFLHLHKVKSLKTKEIYALKIAREAVNQPWREPSSGSPDVTSSILSVGGLATAV